MIPLPKSAESVLVESSTVNFVIPSSNFSVTFFIADEAHEDQPDKAPLTFAVVHSMLLFAS